MLPKKSSILSLFLCGVLVLLIVGSIEQVMAQSPSPASQPEDGQAIDDLSCRGPDCGAPRLTTQERLGKFLFFDQNLSEPSGQACAACHGPAVGYTGPDKKTNVGGAVYEGAFVGRFGNRKPPAAAYAGNSPLLFTDDDQWVGGMFWDGRATGHTLGDPLAEQAQGPFLNPLEQNNGSAQVVIDKVLTSPYRKLFKEVCAVPADYYVCIGRSIAAYERSAEVSSYTSKYDYWRKGQAKLTGQEKRGMELFNGKARCVNCHMPPDFTDFTYDNLGVPRNPANPFYNEPAWNPDGAAWVDTGLGGFLKAAGSPASVYEPEMGKMKVPTLRNVDLRPTKSFVKAYTHNGYFKSLEDLVHFYNTRDLPGAGWPAPEVAVNVNTTELGNLGLTHGEELAIVAFLKTLSDGYPSHKLMYDELSATGAAVSADGDEESAPAIQIFIPTVRNE